MESPDPTTLYACPRCDRSPLLAAATGLVCGGCKVEFPSVDGIPWLFAEPGAAYGAWRGRLHHLLKTLEHQEAQLRAGLDATGTDAKHARLALLADATAAHRTDLATLLAPLDVDSLTADRTTYLALRTKLPADQGLTTYYGNVHRDWCWGDTENLASLNILVERLDGRAPGRTLVLGCGAGRLAHDFHATAGPSRTVAVDFNPLLILIADRMSRGETLELFEFPLAPIDLAHTAVRQTLSAPAPAPVEYCLADVHRPPFPERSFDTIVTPWLVDVLPESIERQAERINRLLDDGGVWINFGSLSFHDADPADRLSPEECVDVLTGTGFAVSGWHDTTIPYLSSPASRHGRTENVASWCAKKTTHARRTARYEALPDWIVRGRDPVPIFEHFRTQALATRIHAHILSLIDGRRSIADMAAMLEQQRLMTRAEAEPAIRQFMITLYEDSRRGHRY